MSLNKLSKLLENKTIIPKKIQSAAYICWLSKKIINRYSSDSEIIFFKNGVLKVGVSSNCVASNLKMKEPEIIEKINKKLKANKITKITTKVL